VGAFCMLPHCYFIKVGANWEQKNKAGSHKRINLATYNIINNATGERIVYILTIDEKEVVESCYNSI
jgi:hypothetical protein